MGQLTRNIVSSHLIHIIYEGIEETVFWLGRFWLELKARRSKDYKWNQTQERKQQLLQ